MKEKQSTVSGLTSKGSTDAFTEKSENPPHYEVPNLTSSKIPPLLCADLLFSSALRVHEQRAGDSSLCL